MSTTQTNPTKEAETLYTTATKAELSGDLDRAFKLYVKAAEQFLHLSHTTPNAAARTKCKTEVAKCLDRAEKIKSKKKYITPVTKDYLSEREQLSVLQKSSIVNGIMYPIWDNPSQTQSRDVSQPKLSAEQMRHSAIWRSPDDGMVVRSDTSSLCPEDVTQHIISDCSFCASIAVCIAHNRAFQSKLGVSALFPQEGREIPLQKSIQKKSPLHSVRLLFNGAYRRVDIDDKFPSYPNGSVMCMSTGPAGELWPTLLEKAYMKLMGGYEFPGSLSSTDLYTLTGWIPEHIDIASPRFEREKTWRRVSSSFRDGRCMVTIGTGPEVPHQAAGPLTLLPAHSYAIIDIIDDETDRKLVALDPWQDQIEAVEADSDLDVGKLSLENKETSSRMFTISWDVLCSVFGGIYLSWDPSLFKNHLNFHGVWKKDGNTEGTFPSNFQLNLNLEDYTRNSEVWLLLTRHIVDSKRTGEFIALSLQESGANDITEVSLKGEYTNNTQILIRISAPESTLSFVVSYDGPYDDVGFSVTAHSSLAMSWAREDTLPYTETVTGKLTPRNAGGNPTLPTFMMNPQYHLRIHPDHSGSRAESRSRKSRVQISLRGDRHIPLNVVAVWSQGQRITDFAHSDVAVSSGAYSYGHASAVQELSAGDYTVIVSAFEPQHTGPYSLKIDSNAQFEVVSQIPQEGAGMYSKPSRGIWTPATAAGAPQFQRYKSNPLYELKLSSQSEILIRLQLVKPDSSISLNVSLFQFTAAQKLGSLVATSGAYSDSICGVLLKATALSAGSYAIVPSTFTPGLLASFKISVYTSASGTNVTYIPGSAST